MTHGTRQRARTCPYIRRGPDSGEKKGVFVGNHGNFQKRRKMTTKGARLEGRESEPAAQVGKRLFQAPSARGETRESRAEAAGPTAATGTQRGRPAGTQETPTGEEGQRTGRTLSASSRRGRTSAPGSRSPRRRRWSRICKTSRFSFLVLFCFPISPCSKKVWKPLRAASFPAEKWFAGRGSGRKMNERGRAGRGGEGGGTRTPGGAQIAPAGGGRGGRGPGWSPDLGKSGLPRVTFTSKIRSTGRKSNAVGQRKKREELRKKAAIPGLRADQMKRN